MQIPIITIKDLEIKLLLLEEVEYLFLELQCFQEAREVKIEIEQIKEVIKAANN